MENGDFDRKIMFKDYLVDSLKQPRIQEIIMNLAGMITIQIMNLNLTVEAMEK